MISVIIPTKEEPGIQQLVDKVNTVIRQPHEVIIVDESAARHVVNGAVIIKQQSHGLGNAFMEGLKEAHGDMIVVMDGDGSHRPDDLPRLISALSSNDIALGSRFIHGGMTFDVTHRKIISVIFRKFASAVLGLGIEDPLSGLCAFKRSVLDKIQLKPLGMKINLEMIYKAKKAGFACKEVPITFERRMYGRSKENSAEALRIIRLVFELRFGLR